MAPLPAGPYTLLLTAGIKSTISSIIGYCLRKENKGLAAFNWVVSAVPSSAAISPYLMVPILSKFPNFLNSGWF